MLGGGCYDNAVEKPREPREINDEFAVNVGIIARQPENDRNIEDATTNCDEGPPQHPGGEVERLDVS